MKNKKDDFVHLHTHSDMSQLDGCATIDAYTRVAKKRGNPAIAFTDHGTMRGYYEAHKRAEEHGIKSIQGIEFYVSKDMHRKGLTQDEKDMISKGLKPKERTIAIKEYENREGIRSRWHLTCWAKNDIGLKNLFKLSSKAYTEGFYYKGRIDIKTLLEYHEGLMIGTGCLASVINDRVISGKRREAIRVADELFDCFGEDLWLEIQPHPIKEQEIANRFALKLLDRYGGKCRLLATQDAHYVSKKHAVHHDVMLCIGTHGFFSDPNRFRFDGDGFFMKNRKQMKSSFVDCHGYLRKSHIKQALDSTMLLSEKCEAKVEVDYLKAILPEVETGKFKTESDYFDSLCVEGWVWRDIPKRAKRVAKSRNEKFKTVLKEYKTRLKYEMGLMKSKKFVSYFLVVYDLCHWARKNKIMIGPARGSSAGSLVAYLLGITAVDPIEHNLLFERFMNPNRCFPANTLVKTKAGWKEIRDIVPFEDAVKTRSDFETVLDKPVRKTKEKLLKITYNFNGFEGTLTTTENHVVFRSINGKVEAQRASDFSIGQRFCFEKSYVYNLRKRICKNGLQQNDMLEKMCIRKIVTKKKVCTKDLPLLQEEKKTKSTDVLFEDEHSSFRKEGFGRNSSAIITKIETENYGEIEVYDLCVERVHEYYANGVLVKNSDMPDIDMDFEDSRRNEIMQYLRKKYGTEKVAQISTIGTLKGKQCVRDVSRVLRIPISSVNEITSSIIERSPGDKRVHDTVKDSFAEFEVFEKFNKKYPDVLPHADHLEGLAKSLGIHAAGVVVAPKPIVEYTPIEVRKYKGSDTIVTALDKDGVAAVGLVKLDVLGLKNLTVIRMCLEMIEERYGKEIDMEGLELDDPEVLQRFTDGDFSGVFQFDTPSAQKLCKGIEFDSFVDLPTINALNRPGAMQSGLAKEWVRKKKKPELRKKSKFHKSVLEATKDTLGVITYQEQVNRIFIDVAGFESAKAEDLRKKISKSKGKESIAEVRDDFIKGALKLHGDDGMNREAAEKIIDAIAFFGKYSFNKAHSTAYAFIAYWDMFLKHYYPLEFYCSLLINEEKTERVQKIAKDCKKRNIKILPPDVSVSKREFSIDPRSENTIRGSLLDIKGVGDKAVITIVENQPYKSFYHFLSKVNRRQCNKGVVKPLIISGAMDNLVPNIKWILDNFDEIWPNVTDKKYLKKALKRSKKKIDYEPEERNLLASTVNPFSFGEHPIVAYKRFLKKNIKVKIAPMGENFYDKYNGKSAFVIGIIVDTKFARIGDFHSGDLPDKEQRKRAFWGARYANVNIEGRDGEQRRVKFDIDVFESVRHIIDKGPGTPILVHLCNINASYSSMKADWAIDLEELRKKVKLNKSLELYERVVTGNHPALVYNWKSKIKDEMTTHKKFIESKIGGVFCGIVTHVSLKYDKNKNQMAFIGILGAKLHIEVVAFSSSWVGDKNKFIAGKLVKIAVEKQRSRGNLSYIYNGGGVKVLNG